MMEWPELPSDQPSSLRRELQGPRPPPLKVRKDSHMIKKPPLPPQPYHHHHHHHHQQQQQQFKQPIIIYQVSPKVIHVKPSDFSAMVQRLTGSSSSSSSSSSSASSSYVDTTTNTSSSSCHNNDTSGAVSPAVRYAVMEKAINPSENNTNTKPRRRCSVSDGFENIGVNNISHEDDDDDDEILINRGCNNFPGILSPQPSSLPPISPNFFSGLPGFPGMLSPQLPSSLPPISPNFFSGLPDPTSLNYIHDLNQIVHGSNYNNKINYKEGSSPQTPIFSPNSMPIIFDLLNQFLDP